MVKLYLQQYDFVTKGYEKEMKELLFRQISALIERVNPSSKFDNVTIEIRAFKKEKWEDKHYA